MIPADNFSMSDVKTICRSFSPLLRRVAWGGACIAAFMVMASVFTPDRLRAGDELNSLRGIPPRAIDPKSPSTRSGAQPGEPLPSHGTRDSTSTHEDSSGVNLHETSADPHEGLCSLGVIEHARYIVHIFATDSGPRYTVHERATGCELGALLSVEQVHRGFPDLKLPSMELTPASNQAPLLMADTPDDQW